MGVQSLARDFRRLFVSLFGAHKKTTWGKSRNVLAENFKSRRKFWDTKVILFPELSYNELLLARCRPLRKSKFFGVTKF